MNTRQKAFLQMEYYVIGVVEGKEKKIGRHYILYSDDKNKEVIYRSPIGNYKYRVLEYAKKNNIEIINN